MIISSGLPRSFQRLAERGLSKVTKADKKNAQKSLQDFIETVSKNRSISLAVKSKFFEDLAPIFKTTDVGERSCLLNEFVENYKTLFFSPIDLIETEKESSGYFSAARFTSAVQTASRHRNKPGWFSHKEGDLTRTASLLVKSIEAKTLSPINAILVNMNGFDRVAVEHRDDLIAKAISLTPDHMNGIARARVIETLAKVTPEQRDDFTAKAISLITDDMNGDNRARVIEALARVPFGERTDKVNRVLADRRQGDGIERLREILEAPLNQPIPPR